MKKIEFEIDDDLTAVEGIAVIHCIRDDGEMVTAQAGFGDPSRHAVLGLLLGTLDEARSQYREGFQEFEEE